MTDRSRLDRAWPSLVALFGTIAVVLALLWAFGDDSVPAGNEDGDLVAEGDEGASDAEEEEPEEEPEPTPTASEESEPPPEPTTAPPEVRSPVAILNSTSVTGLAAGAQEILQAGGWEVPATDNYSGDLSETTIYYPDDSMRESAEALAAQFPEIGAAEPTIEGLTRQRLVLILASDWAEEYGDAEQAGQAG